MPSTPLRVNYRAQVRIFNCELNGQPVPEVGVSISHDSGRNRKLMGPDGRIALLIGPKHQDALVEFQTPGFHKVTKPLGDQIATLSSQTIEMEPNSLDTGSLAIELIGDPERQVERFSIQLRPVASDSEPAREPDPWRANSWKRTGDTLRVEGIEPGSYELILAADDPTNSATQEAYPDTAAMILSETREVTFAPAEESHVSIDLQLGGRLWGPALYSTENSGIPPGALRFRIVDKQGYIANGRWVTASGNWVGQGFTTGRIYQVEDTFFDPPLPAGQYMLELWRAEDESDLITTPFKITAGEVTTLEIVDPR